MPTLAKLLAAAVPLKVSFAGVVLELQWRPAAVTNTWLESWDSLPVTQAIVDLVVGWDLVDEDSKPEPVSLGAVEALPPMAQRAIWEALVREIFPNSTSAGTS